MMAITFGYMALELYHGTDYLIPALAITLLLLDRVGPMTCCTYDPIYISGASYTDVEGSTTANSAHQSHALKFIQS
jgi:hypothetical protein